MTHNSKSPAQRADQDGVFRQIMGSSSLRSKNEKDRVVEFVASDGSVDSYGTVLPVDKWDLRRYQKNGVVGYQHGVYGDSKDDDPDNVIGKGEARIEKGQLVVRVTFEPADLNPKAEKVFRKVLFGTLNGVSVGFQPTREGHFGKKEKGEDPEVYYYEGQELLEVSIVNIPANANAVKRGSSQPSRHAKVALTAAEREVMAKANAVLDTQSKNDAREAERAAVQALASAQANALLAKQYEINK